MAGNPILRIPMHEHEPSKVTEFPSIEKYARREPATAALVPLARLLFSAVFIMGSYNEFTQAGISYAAQAGVPRANVLVPLAGLAALFGGLSILIGNRARFGAFLLVVFLVPVTYMMHRFWGLTDQVAAQQQFVNFIKNVGLLGGALLFLHYGAGPFSVDRLRERRKLWNREDRD